jgi:predicted exporter
LTKRSLLGVAWAIVVALLAAHAAWLWSSDRLAPDTDILAMLPLEERDPVLQQAITHMADVAQQRMVVLIGTEDWKQTQQAADAYRDVLLPHTGQFQLKDRQPAQSQQAWLDQFWPYRAALLTASQRQSLAAQPAAYWVDTAQRQIYSPFGAIKLGAWQDDPFGLFAGWIQARAQETAVRAVDGRLRIDDGKIRYAVLPIELRGQSFSLSAQQAMMPLLRQAEDAARHAVPGVEIVSAGVILHAAAAGEQANFEMSTIGWGSMIGVLVLMWFMFRSLKPIALVALSIGIGCLGALSVCWLLFDRVHMLTLVFGASLIGVAEDYGIHYFCSRVGDLQPGLQPGSQPDSQPRDPWETLRKLMPGLVLAMLTTIVAYLALALTPFPGLRQMAVFSAAGLVFAWLTVVCWFPLMDGGPLRATALVDWYGSTRTIWPELGRNRASVAVSLVVIVFVGAGLARLQANDDIRLLQNSPRDLLEAQVKVGKLLEAPSMAQFYLVRGETQEQVLQREEALRARLDVLVASQVVTGYQALSNWVPSQRAQLADRELVMRGLLAPGAALSRLAAQLGEDREWAKRVAARLTQPAAPLTPEVFVQSPASEAWRHLWLGKVAGGYASVVALRGVERNDLPVLQAAGQNLAGVQWVDKVGETSSLLGRYRQEMGWVVLMSYLTVFALLFLRYRMAAWRVLAPTVVASALTLAVFGIAGQPLNLFHVLGLLLVLGMGVDYGIFLQEHPSREDKTAWVAVGLSAVCSLLSFGLLGLSKTPALQAFGLTMLLGIGIVWLIAPCLRADNIKKGNK